MNEKDYNSAEGIRRSDLWLLSDSPEKFRFAMDNPEEEKNAAFLFGSAAHKWILEQKDFFNEYAIAPQVDRRTNAGKEAWAAFVAESEGKEIISQDDFDTIKAMREALEKHPLAGKILFGKGGENEKAFFWTDKETGEKCKCKLDRLTKLDRKLTVIDYKTAASARTEEFNRKVLQYGYHVQSAMYTDGVMKCKRMRKRPRFIFIVQEKKAPYSVNCIEVSWDVMEYGEKIYRTLLGQYHVCKEIDMWDGYCTTELNQTELPAWAGKEMEEVY